jgi:hypothetical protein
MTDLGPAYVKQIWKDKRVNAIYPPGETVKLGDIYIYDDGVYNYYSNLKEFDIKVESETSPGETGWSSKSKNSTKIVAKSPGRSPTASLPPPSEKADAGAIVQFTDANAYVLSLGEVKVRKVTNLVATGEKLRDLWFSNKWDSKYLIVTQVWDCPSATILTSGSDSAQVELKAKADVKIANVDITDLSTKFTLESEGKSTDHFVASELTPSSVPTRSSSSVTPCLQDGGTSCSTRHPTLTRAT